VSLQIQNHYLIILWALFSIYTFVKFNNPFKSFIITNLLFGIGFFIYLYVINNWFVQVETKELYIFLNRFSLVIVLFPMMVFSLFSNSKFISYWRKPRWNERIYFPFIWSGFHSIKVRPFLFIALTINILIFMPFIILNGWSFFREIWLLAIVFSITNAVFEEMIWRGTLLSRFSEQLGEKWAVAVTSLGFGLQHYSLGFPWIICIAFSIGGIFYGGITVKSKSIFPSMIWHITLNLLMIFSGLILK
jgi:CAAX protease family protein